MALADRMASLFVKRLGSEPILGVRVDPTILHRGTANFSGASQVIGNLKQQPVVTLVTQSHLLLVESGRLLFATPWTLAKSLIEADEERQAWILEVNFPNHGVGAIGLEPRNIRETELFAIFINSALKQMKTNKQKGK